jgi:hypothetical protein
MTISGGGMAWNRKIRVATSQDSATVAMVVAEPSEGGMSDGVMIGMKAPDRVVAVAHGSEN